MSSGENIFANPTVIVSAILIAVVLIIAHFLREKIKQSRAEEENHGTGAGQFGQDDGRYGLRIVTEERDGAEDEEYEDEYYGEYDGENEEDDEENDDEAK
ncbi:MAG: hypothetical protein FWH32_03815 [Clostridiales bacterium]|nr:hypothetical protein [Clostridiales bacterium]